MNPMEALHARGQSVWLDYIRRDLVLGGELTRMVAGGLRGMTSNPTIFEKAVSGSADYDDQLRTLLGGDPTLTNTDLFERLAVDDIRMAADVLRTVYDSSGGADGFVSLEVSPHLAHDTAGTVAEAHRLWEAVDRPNLMIKVPATVEGIPAIETLIGDGLNVNVTLIFALHRYEAAARAYLSGLERAPDPSRVASVASFFVSRVDTAVDKALEDNGSEAALALRGRAAVANARLAYRLFGELFGDGFAGLRERGARPQRLLWASTSTKNPAYSDVMYVTELIGDHTVNTMPPATLDAFRDHGEVRGDTILEDVDRAAADIEALAGFGIDFDAVTDRLEADGVKAFADSFDQLMAAIEGKRRALDEGRPDHQVLYLGGYDQPVQRRLESWAEGRFDRRLWDKDPTLWFSDERPEITDRLGWLNLPVEMRSRVGELEGFAAGVRGDGIEHVVLLGMGGSSLAPEVFQTTFHRPGHPRLLVLDSTHPGAIRAVEESVDMRRTLFVVSSKSGTTLETHSFFLYFWSKVAAVTDGPGRHFVAITDPGSSLEKLAAERGFRQVFQAPPDVGGRYSALTVFGLVPAALVGADIARMLERAWTMQESCAFCVTETHNCALALGAALGELALAGRDKATFLVSPSLSAFPAWLEQLVAESTGKDGRGILPVAGEAVGDPEVYGDDRFFISFAYTGDNDYVGRAAVEALRDAGHPVAIVTVDEKEDLGAEMYRAEVAVAAAGAVLGIHPFDQPDVQLAKDLAKRAMAGEAVGGDIAASDPDDAEALGELLGSLGVGDYFSIQAYLAPDPGVDGTLERIRLLVRDRRRVATTVGYGPRFLHSTGQLHKGGPNTGVFLQIVDRPASGTAVPETDYTFERLVRAQADGDYGALAQRDRRILRIDLAGDVAGGLADLEKTVIGALEASAR